MTAAQNITELLNGYACEVGHGTLPNNGVFRSIRQASDFII